MTNAHYLVVIDTQEREFATLLATSMRIGPHDVVCDN
jgi:hypothetical protein